VKSPYTVGCVCMCVTTDGSLTEMKYKV